MTDPVQERQHTLAKTVRCSGVGIHTGQAADVTILPAPTDTGIVFKRTDLAENNEITAHTAFVAGDAQRCTMLRNKRGASAQTVEHVMAALWAAGIDNAVVEINGPELPILDGSAAQWSRLLRDAGATEQAQPRKLLKILKPVRVQDGDRWLRIEPADRFSIDVDIDYPHPAIGRQHVAWDATQDGFDAIAHAKTFGFEKEIDQMHAAGLGKGVTMENAIIFNDCGPVNSGILHYPGDEPVRHKVLDIVGDSALSGMRILGRITGHAPGHHLTHRLMNELFKEKNACEIINADSPAFSAGIAGTSPRMSINRP